MGDTAAAPAAGRSPDVVGREAELVRIRDFAASLGDGPRALVIRGDPGIGKTTLWLETVEECRRAGFPVVLTRPAEEEMPLPLVGLVDLFEHAGLEPEVLRAGDDPLARGRAVLEALRRLAGESPALVAIDDVQWLDAASARALRFALRRLDAEPVGVVAATRRTAAEADPLGVAAALKPGRVATLEPGRLSHGALRRVVAGTVESISRPAMRRIHEVSGGNPLYAIELARGLAADDRAHGAGAAPTLPDSLQAAIERRLELAPAELTGLLETAAGLGPTSVAVLRETMPGADVDALLALAARHELLVLEEDLGVRFAHPLLASAVYARMSPLARRSLHARLADRATDPDDRARHLALSTDGTDPAVAELLGAAAERARRRGATELAAEYAGHSVRLTPPEDRDARIRRQLAEIESRAAAGEASRALALADLLIASLPAGPERTEALIKRFFVGDDELEAGDRLLQRALEDAGEDEALRSRVLDMLGWLRGMFGGDMTRGVECATEAFAIAEGCGDARVTMLAAGHLGHMSMLSGRPRPDLMERAVALADELGGPRLGGSPRAWLGKHRFWSGDLDAARALIQSVLADDRRSGNELERPYRLYDLALLECAAGNLAEAEELVRRGLEAARDAENADAEAWMWFPHGLVSAWLGRPDEARAAADRLLEWTSRHGGRTWIVRAKSVLGLLALSEDDLRTACRELTEAAALLDETGFRHPGALPILPDAVEALAHTGETEEAGRLLERLEREADAVDSDWARAAAGRSRGVYLLALGDAEAAVGECGRAAASFDRLGSRTGSARAMLWQGRALLRAGKRRQSADVLGRARDRFAATGAALWEARAAAELERAAPGGGAGELTAAERRIAVLVSQGERNREIAQALFMSVATVEAHLTRMYRKLDIRSRSELARLVSEGDPRVAQP